MSLFSPLTIKDVIFRNRIAVSPMCQYSAEDGFANDWHLVHLGSRAVGGAGLVIVEASGVEARGRISAGDLGIYKDEHIAPLKRVVDFIHEQGAVAGIQIAHAGRKASDSIPWSPEGRLQPEQGGWPIIAPSAEAFDPNDAIVPKAMTLEDIAEVKDAFVQAARRAYETGFKVLEIHAAHGYLIHEFLSPISNFRTDHYGGSFENRTRLLREIVQDVKSVWPGNLPLFVRISAIDWLESGWTNEDSVELSKQLKTLGVDLIDCSSGAITPGEKIAVGPGYQVPFAEQIKAEAGILTGAVGMITEAEQAEQIIQQGKADLVLLARELLRDPYWPLHAATELGVDIAWPNQYARAAKPRVRQAINK